MADQVNAAPAPPAPEGRNARFDAFLAVLLGITAILTAVASYQGALKDGDVIANYSTAQQAQADGNTNYLDGIATLSRDYTASALIIQKPEAEKDLKDIFSDPYRKYYDSEDPEAEYVPEEVTQAQKDFVRATKFQDVAEKADKVGDDYNLVTVIAAVALFFLGIAGVTASRVVRLSMTGFGVAALTMSLIFYAGAAG
jgi:hypothetical protein